MARHSKHGSRPVPSKIVGLFGHLLSDDKTVTDCDVLPVIAVFGILARSGKFSVEELNRHVQPVFGTGAANETKPYNPGDFSQIAIPKTGEMYEPSNSKVATVEFGTQKEPLVRYKKRQPSYLTEVRRFHSISSCPSTP